MKPKRRQHRRRGARRQGFTLTEVLLVMAILVMIASMATVAIFTANRRATRNAVLSEISTMENACTQFRLQLQRYPAKLEDLFTPPQGVSVDRWGGPYLDKGDIMDPWNNPYNYEANEGQDLVRISSAGPDGQPGTDDDIPNPNDQR